jgi:sulfatase maturation enzyme AslB (radical SAM superfamily)
VANLIQLTPQSLLPEAALPHGLLSDKFGRVHDNLRISVTDRCNIRCFYCMPEVGGDFAPASQLLTFEQIRRFVSVAETLGITQIRITGGEPLLRPRLAELVEALAANKKLKDVERFTMPVFGDLMSILILSIARDSNKLRVVTTCRLSLTGLKPLFRSDILPSS